MTEMFAMLFIYKIDKKIIKFEDMIVRNGDIHSYSTRKRETIRLNTRRQFTPTKILNQMYTNEQIINKL